MDFDTELLQIQGALTNANSLHPFPKLTSWGGKEAEIKKVLEVLQKAFSSKTGNEKSKSDSMCFQRKVSLFLILNADLSILHELSNSDDLGHIVWVVPTIPKCLLFHLIWGLNLEQFYCEAIQYGSPELAVDLLNVATLNLKHTDPDKILNSVRLLTFSVYAAVLNIHENKIKFIKCNFDKIQSNVCEILKSFTDYDKPKTKRREKNEFHLYTGKAIRSLFQLMNDCFCLFLKPINNTCEELNIYKYTFIDGKTNTEVELSQQSKVEVLEMFNGILMRVAEAVVMCVDVDMFCTWCELEDDNDANKTLQSDVGQLAYQLKAIMESDARLENEKLTLMLQEISIKPVAVEDIIKDASRDDILKNSLIVNDDQKLWLAAMIRKKHFFFDEECMDCALKNISLFPNEDHKFMFDNAVSLLHGDVEIDSINRIKPLAVAAFLTFCPEDQPASILATFSKFPLSNILELPDFDLKLTEFLNKLLTVTANDISIVYGFFIQNAEKLYREMFKKCFCNNHETDTIFDVLKCLKVFSRIKFDCELKHKQDDKQNLVDVSIVIFNVFNEIFKDLLDSNVCPSHGMYLYFTECLVKNELINNEVLLTKCLMPKIHTSLKERKLESLHLFVNILSSVCLITTPTKTLLAPLIAMLAQIMEIIRPALDTFNRTSIFILEDLEKLITRLLTAFLETTKPSDKEYSWLCNRISGLCPINGYYFQKLWQQQDHKEFFDLGLTDNITALSLCYLLPRSTNIEWDMIFSSLLRVYSCDKSFNLMCSTLKLICEAGQEINSESSAACVNYCIINTAGILGTKVLSQEEITFSVICNVVSVINSLGVENESTIIDYVLLSLANVIKKYIKGKKETNEDDEPGCDIKKLISSISSESFKLSLQEMLIRDKIIE